MLTIIHQSHEDKHSASCSLRLHWVRSRPVPSTSPPPSEVCTGIDTNCRLECIRRWHARRVLCHKCWAFSASRHRWLAFCLPLRCTDQPYCLSLGVALCRRSPQEGEPFTKEAISVPGVFSATLIGMHSLLRIAVVFLLQQGLISPLLLGELRQGEASDQLLSKSPPSKLPESSRSASLKTLALGG